MANGVGQYSNDDLAVAGFNEAQIEAIHATHVKPLLRADGSVQSPVTSDATGVLSAGRASVEKTLVVGAYADQALPADDYTLGATGVVTPQRGYLTGVELLAGTSVTLTLQDSPDAATGRTVWSIPATSAPRRWDFPKPVPFHTGLYATIGGTGPAIKFLLGGSE